MVIIVDNLGSTVAEDKGWAEKVDSK